MDNSLIPRAFSPTDAKRRAEENAREAERRSSARNTSSSTIPAGGKQVIAGGLEVVDGGTVDVVGQGFDNTGAPYEIRGRVTSIEDEGNYGTYKSPAFVFSSAIFGENAASIYSRDGRRLTATGSQAGVGSTSMLVDQTGGGIYFTDTSPAYGDTTGKYRESSMDVKSYGFRIKFRDDLANAASAIIADRNGNIDIQTTGALTQNGAPISGGSGAVSSVAGKTGDVALVKADVGLDQADNTSDLLKPVSNATQTALNGKANTTHTHAIADVTGLQTALDAKQTNSDSGWISPAYGSPWADYGGGFGGFQYRRLNGVLYIRGTIKGGTSGTTITTLPAGYRPIPPAGSTAMEFPALVYQDPNFVPVTCYAYADGRINYAGTVANWTGYNRLIILDNFPL